MLMMTFKFLRWMYSTRRMDEGVVTSEKCWSGAGDLKRIELAENWTCVNVLEKKICKLNPKILMEEKSWRTWKSNQNVLRDEELVQNVRDEELVQNSVMDEKIVKNFVMNAKIDPKVKMDLPMFKISGWNSLQHSKRKLLEEFVNENEPWLLISIPSRDSFLMIQYLERPFVSADPNVKELMPLCEGLHEMMHCDKRQLCAASNDLNEHPMRHTSWRASTRMKFMNIQMEYSKMRSESSEYLCKTTGAFTNSWRIKIALESYFEEHAQKIGKRNLRKTTLTNTCNPVLMETILEVFREQFIDDDRWKTAGEIAGLVPETSLGMETILKE